MGFYTASVSTDGSGDGTNSVNGRCIWNGSFHGLLMGIRIDDNGAAATVDVTITEPNGLMRTILTVTDITSDTSYNPQSPTQTSAAVATTFYIPFRVDSNNLKVTVAQGGTSITNAIIVTVDILE